MVKWRGLGYTVQRGKKNGLAKICKDNFVNILKTWNCTLQVGEFYGLWIIARWSGCFLKIYKDTGIISCKKKKNRSTYTNTQRRAGNFQRSYRVSQYKNHFYSFYNKTRQIFVIRQTYKQKGTKEKDIVKALKESNLSMPTMNIFKFHCFHYL